MLKIEDIYDIYKSHPVICTDTRSIENNSIFFALKGDNFDANDFAEEALKKGAAYCVVDNQGLPEHERLLKVDNVLSTLQALARHHRSKLKIPFIGLTGSNGKTTTKELLHAVLSKKFKVLSTNGNFNNHIGVPLTILRIKKEHEIAIIEMGANHIGEIEFLSEISQPDYGIITNIGKAHLKGFGSYEGVIKAKTELYKFIKSKNGKLFVFSEDKLLMAKSEKIDRQLYGKNTDCDASHSVDEFGQVKVHFNGGMLAIQTNLFGEYNFQNILCSICVGRYFNVEQELIHEALSSYMPDNNRSQIVKKSGNTVILDAYNANPSSMKLALESFDKLNSNKKVVILGDMLELGNEENSEHQKIVEQLQSMKIDEIYLVGKAFNSIASNKLIHKLDNIESLINLFEKKNFNDFHFLIKGSRGIKLEKILDSIN